MFGAPRARDDKAQDKVSSNLEGGASLMCGRAVVRSTGTTGMGQRQMTRLEVLGIFYEEDRTLTPETVGRLIRRYRRRCSVYSYLQ
jgi:hypothetical protein